MSNHIFSRGKLKDLKEIQSEDLDIDDSIDLRLKQLYLYAVEKRDQNLINATGFIPFNQSGINSVSLYRHKEYLNTLSKDNLSKIQNIKLELDGLWEDQSKPVIKIASKMNFKYGTNKSFSRIK